MKVYRYWAEPATADDSRLLMQQLARAASYRRELARLENHARAMQRSILALPKEERKPYQTAVQQAQRAATKAARDRARETTADSLGCSWGTCGQVDDAFDGSQRTTKLHVDVSTHAPRDEGLLAVQYQRHESNPKWEATMASALVGGDDTFVQIGDELVGKPKRRAPGTTGAKRLQTLRFRVGSNGRAPIWANLYILMHRPLPDARVTWVKLSCRRVGLRHRWFLLVVVDEECRGVPDQQRGSEVGVDIGWRRRDDGAIRVAYWWGSDGREGELAIPERVTRRKGKSDSLKSIRDRERNEVAALWRGWIFGSTSAVPTMETDTMLSPVTSAAPSSSADDYLLATSAALITGVDSAHGIPVDHPVRVAAKAMHMWTRMGHFVVLARLWDSHRVPGDEAIYARVQEWLKHDRHLYAWEANNRRRMALQVCALIDGLAVQLARQYDMIAVEERGMVAEIVKKDPEHDQDEERLRALSATRMGIVAPASMRAALERFAKKYGALYREVNPAHTTRDCAECGAARVVDDPAELMLGCDKCGVVEDQDRTAARNILNRARLELEAERAEALTPTSAGPKAKRMGPRRTRRAAKPAATETDNNQEGASL
jgi:transposase